VRCIQRSPPHCHPPRSLHSSSANGRPWSLPPDGMLGLLMCYLESQMSNKWLCLIFRITPSPCLRILRRMLRMTVKRLRSHPLARVEFPNEARMRLYLDMVSAREPMVTNVIGFMDGLGLTTECTDERRTQNVYYCGYDCDTMVNNVLVFGPDGKVFFCSINYPGSWADGTLTSRFSITSKRELAILRFVWTRDFPNLVTHMAFLSGRFPRGALVDCIVLFVIT